MKDDKVTNYKNIKKLGLCIIAFEGTEHLYNIISELRQSVDYVSIGLQRVSYHGDKISNIDLQEILRLRDEDCIVDNIIEVELDITKAPRVQETDKRNILIQDAEDHGCSHAIVIDSDEYYTKKSFEDACRKIDENNYEITYCQYVNYYHDYTHYLVYPFKKGMYVPFVTKTKYRHQFDCTDFTLPSDPTRRFVRPYQGTETVIGKDGKTHKVKNYTVQNHVFEWNEVKMHHLSWLRADIRKKLNMWSSKKCFENYNDLIDRAVQSFIDFDPTSEHAQALMLLRTPGNSIDVKQFPRQYIHPKVDFNTRLRAVHNYKKILVLSMSANIPLFNELEKVSNETWRNIDHEKYPNIDVDFWTYTDAAEGDDTHVDKENHIIYIKKDYSSNGLYKTYSKTIYALQEIKKLGLKYDYIVRTNNSTWINIPLVNEFLSYQEDDSLVFGGRVCTSFWSAFNLYVNGNLLIMSKRNIDILLECAGPNPEGIEKNIQGCDDNIIFGILNQRLRKLNLRQSAYVHSLEDEPLIDKDINLDDITFDCIAYQVKTFFVDDETRIQYDVEKMRLVDKKWRECSESLEDLHSQMMANRYDKKVHIIRYDKMQWQQLSDKERTLARFNFTMNRTDGLKWIRVRQKECGYCITLI